MRYEAFNSVLDQHENITVVATGEGAYDRDTSLTVMQDILQSNPQVDAVLSNADQHLSGAEIAIIDAGRDLEAMYLIGGGATQEVYKRLGIAWIHLHGHCAGGAVRGVVSQDADQAADLLSGGETPAGINITAETSQHSLRGYANLPGPIVPGIVELRDCQAAVVGDDEEW